MPREYTKVNYYLHIFYSHKGWIAMDYVLLFFVGMVAMTLGTLAGGGGAHYGSVHAADGNSDTFRHWSGENLNNCQFILNIYYGLIKKANYI